MVNTRRNSIQHCSKGTFFGPQLNTRTLPSIKKESYGVNEEEFRRSVRGTLVVDMKMKRSRTRNIYLDTHMHILRFNNKRNLETITNHIMNIYIIFGTFSTHHLNHRQSSPSIIHPQGNQQTHHRELPTAIKNI